MISDTLMESFKTQKNENGEILSQVYNEIS